MALTRIVVERFTAFRRLDLSLCPGLNVFIGANGTGKTHLLKLAYGACSLKKNGDVDFATRLTRLFLPDSGQIGRLVHRQQGSTKATAELHRNGHKLRVSFSNHAKTAAAATVTGAADWGAAPLECAYVPVKEMLANAPGFRSLYAQREIHFEEVYADIVDRAFRPILRGPMDADRKRLLGILQKAIEGKVVAERETFFLKNKQGRLEFTLLAEGLRKLALLWLLIQNGTLLRGSVLFWDEPEANLNPKVVGQLVEILIELQRLGVQVFLATHDYVVLKELDLRRRSGDTILFHSLYRTADGGVAHSSTDEYTGIHPNAIADTFADLLDRDMARALAPASKR